ncbi:MAG: RNA polymerase sigma factor [Verrucomicrobiota bacterium]
MKPIPMPTTDSPDKPKGAAERDLVSLSALFTTEESPLLRYAYSLVGRRAVAEDIVQEVFLQLHRHWSEVDNPRAWLYRSVRNRSYNHNRDHKKEVLTDETEESSDPKATKTPDEELSRMEAAGFLRQSMADLPEGDRQLVQLKYFEDLKYAEIAKKTGLSVSNVGYRLHHILKQLAGKLRQLGIEGTS